MAVTLTSVTVIGTGVANNAVIATSETVTITVDDLSRTFIRLENQASSTAQTAVFAPGSAPSVAHGIGSMTVTLTSGQTQYVGASWDSARFKTTSNTITITIAGSGSGVKVEACKMAVY